MTDTNTVVNDLKKFEQRSAWINSILPYGIALGIFESFTGFYLYFIEQMNQVEMMFLLAHIFLGFLLAFFPYVFLKRHAGYKKIFSDSLFNHVGILTLISALISICTGVYLTFVGVAGNNIIWQAHLFSSIFWVFFLGYYAWSFLSKIYKTKNIPAQAFIKYKIEFILKTSLAALAITTLIFFAAGVQYKNTVWFKKISNYSLPFKTQNIFYPSVVNVSDNTRAINPKALGGSRSCGTMGCHSEILKQWEQSYHLKTPNPFAVAAMKDFAEEIKSGKLFYGKIGPHIQKIKQSSQKTAIESLRRCTGCHDTISMLAGETTPHENFSVETQKQHEGVSCLVCHAISKTYSANSKYEKFEISEPQRYLFSDSENYIGQFLYETLIKTKPESHRKTFMKDFYKDSLYCMSCHRGAVQYRPWKSSPYSPETNALNSDNIKHCQDCHMEPVQTTNDISAKQKGTVSDHRFLAIGTAMAKYYGLKDQQDATEKFLKTDKIKMRLVGPKAIPSLNKLTIYLQIANAGVGHFFPGAPDSLIEAWPELRVTDSRGYEISSYGKLDKNGYLDYNKTKVLRTIMYDRNGNALQLDRHQTWRATSKKFINIQAKEYIEFPIKISFNKKVSPGPIKITAKLKLREPRQQFADWVFGKGKFVVPIVDVAEDELEIQISTDRAETSQAASNFKEQLLSGGFESYKKSTSDFIINARVDLDDRAIKIILREIALLVEAKRFSEALALIKELKIMHPMKELLNQRISPIEKEIREKLGQ